MQPLVYLGCLSLSLHVQPILFFCFKIYSVMSAIIILFLISEHGTLPKLKLYQNIAFSFPLLFEQLFVCQLFHKRPCQAAIGHCLARHIGPLLIFVVTMMMKH